jgi:hypothetical protein
MDGGTRELDSIWGADEPPQIQEPTDEAAQAIAQAVHDPRFMPQLLACILRQIHGHNRAQSLGFTMTKGDLPGGVSVESLAHELLERILLGKRPWDMEKYPDFLIFCQMHAKSMVANLFDLRDSIRRESASPVEEEDSEGNLLRSVVVDHNIPAEEGNRVQRRKEFDKIADSFLTDFAFSLEDNSTEQKIIMAVIDDKNTVVEPRDGSVELLAVDRPYMIEKLGVTGKEFDAGLKRLQRKHKSFLPEWLAAKKLTSKEIGELLHGL